MGRIFLTGVTGYVGGTVLASLMRKHPYHETAVLVRDDKQARKIKTAFPSVETVLGSLDTKDVLLEQAGKADVCLNLASSDHIPGATALVEGAAEGRRGGCIIQISGTGILLDASTGYGNLSEKIYNDMNEKDIAEIQSFGRDHIHRDTEEAFLLASKDKNVRSAIVCPPLIYGTGKGPVKKTSVQIPTLIDLSLKRGKAFQILEGQNVWSNIHVEDLADILILLINEALKGRESKLEWGPSAYFFAETSESNFADISSEVGRLLHGRGALPSPAVDKISMEEAAKLDKIAGFLLGANSRSRAERIRSLGWKSHNKGLMESLQETVDVGIANSALS